MLTYEDCLAFSGLSPATVAAIARHEHLPDMLALELGVYLCRTAAGRETVRRMIRDDLAEARRRGATDEAAALAGLLDRVAASGSPPPAPGDLTLAQRIRALGVDAAAAPWVQRRVEAYLRAMARRFGVAADELQASHPLELLAAETRCAACAETARCRRFLAGTAPGDAPEAFCPNAGLLAELGGGTGR